jgi:AcrR family transcriptional regulator
MTVSRNKKAISRETSITTIKTISTKLFVDKGYSNFRVDDMAALCGFTKGTVYHYYKSKEDILFDILEDIERSILDEHIMAPESPRPDAAGRLLTFLYRHAEYAVRNPQEFCLLVILSMEFSNSDCRIGNKVRSIFDRLTDTLAGLIAQGVESGEFVEVLAAQDFARVVVGCYNGNVVEWKRSNFDPTVGRSLVKGVRTLIMKALLGRPISSKE